MWFTSWFPLQATHGGLVLPYRQLFPTWVSTRVLKFVLAPTEALFEISRFPRTITFDCARLTFGLRQRFPATYMREEPAMLLFRVWSQALPVCPA